MSYLYSKLPETGVSPHIGTEGSDACDADDRGQSFQQMPATKTKHKLTSCDSMRSIAAKSTLLIFDVARAVATVRKPFSVSRSLMIFPDTLFRHSGRTTAEGFIVVIQLAKRFILLPPPCRMLSDTIRMAIAGYYARTD